MKILLRPIAGGVRRMISAALVVCFALAIQARADTFLWNGAGVSGGTGDSILNTSGNWSPTSTPGISDIATVTLNSSASLGQSAGLNVGTFAVTTLQGGTITFTETNTFSAFSVGGNSNIVVNAGTTTVVNSFTQSGAALILIGNGGVLNLPSAYSNAGVLNITRGAVVGTASVATAPSGLIGLWHFDGDFLDSSSYAHPSTAYNTPVIGAGKVGSGAGSFNGSNYVRVSDSNSITNPSGTVLDPSQISIECWINTANLAGYRNFVSKEGSWLFLLTGMQVQQWNSGGGWSAKVTDPNNVTANTWTQFVVTMGTDGFKLYRNGVLVASNPAAYIPVNVANDIWIGYREGAAQPYTGLIDELAIFNRVLSADEILAHYNRTNGGSTLTESFISGLLPSISSGTITNLAGAQINVSDGGLFDASLPWFNNRGSLTVGSGGKAVFSNIGTQTGTITIGNGGSIVGTAAWTNTGILRLAGGTVSGAALTNSATVTGFGVISAPFILNAGANLVVSGGSLQLTSASAPVTNGTIRVAGNQLVVSAMNWTQSGSLVINGGSIQTGGTLTLANHLVDYGTVTVGSGALVGALVGGNAARFGALSGTMTLDLANNAGVQNVVFGPFLIASQSTNTVAFTNSFTFTDTANLSFIQPYNQTFVVAGGNGTMTLNSAAGAQVYFHSGVGTSGTIVGAVANAGTAAIYTGMSGTSFTFTKGFYNLPGATFRADSAIQLNTDITNQGHLLQLVGTINGNITSSGSMTNNNYALLAWTGTLTNSGAIAEGFSRFVLAGANSRFVNAGTVESNFLPNQTWSGGGYSFSIEAPNGGTITNDVTGRMFTRPGFGSLSLSGYIQNRGTMSGLDKSIVFTGGTLTNESTGFLTGNLDLTSSRLNNLGTISVPSGSRVVLGTVTAQTGAVTVGAGGVLNGTQKWTNAGYLSLSTASEVLLNTNTGLVNTGEIVMNGAGTGKIGGGAGLQTNTGTLRVSGGTLLINVASGLIGLWHFDTAGTFTDSSAFGHNTTTVTSGGHPIINMSNFKVGDGAGSFNAGGYVSVADTTAVTNPNGNVLDPKEITIQAWLNTGTVQADAAYNFVAKATSYLFLLQQDSLGRPLQFWDGGYVHSLTSTTPTPSGTWFHVAVTAGPNGVTIYQNGATVAFSATPYLPANSTNNMWIGAREDYTQRYRGLIDELAIFNRVLPASEILAHYNLTNGGASLTEQFIASQLGIGSFTNASNGNVLITGGVADFSNTEMFNLGTLAVSANGMAVLGTVSSQTGTITATDGIIASTQPAWTNNGYVSLSRSEIRMPAGGTFFNYNYVSAGSSISGNYVNAGTFTLTDATSITGNFTNAGTGWTTLNGYELQVQGAAGTTNDGTIIAGAGTLANTTGGLLNNSSGLITLAGGGITGGAVSNNGALSGYGVVSPAFTNNLGAIVTAAGGQMLFTSMLTNAGEFRLGSSGSFRLEDNLANEGDGSSGGILRDTGAYIFAPSGEATFSNTVTQAVASGGGVYDTRSLTFAIASGTLNFEVTSNDVGANLPKVPANGFSLGTLVLPNTLTLLRLTDIFDNEAGGVKEAIYVQNLMLGDTLTAANFDFGSGLKIYYNNIIGGAGYQSARTTYFGNIIPLNTGGGPVAVPEPGTFALLLLGLPLLWLLRRRQGKDAAH